MRSILLLASAAGLMAQTPAITGVANNTTQFLVNNAIAPGEEVNVFGSNLGDATTVSCGSPTGFTTSCGGVSVTIAGKAAGVRNENATSVVIQVPVDAPLGNTQLVLTRAAGGQNLVSQPFAVNVVATAPQFAINNVNGVPYASCFNGANLQISPNNPVASGDPIRCIGNGFGVTNPVVPTGTVPPTPLAAVVAPVTVTVAGKNATVNSATLATSNFPVGFDQVIFVVPQGIGPGNQPLVANVGGISTITFQLPVFVLGPYVSSVSNAASNIVPGLPNAGIAQGAIFVVKGNGLGPANIAIAPAPFQNTSLSGTSVAVTIGSTVVNALMYYTSDGQVAALLPSNTPTGTGTIAVTFNGKTSFPQPITVVANNLGIFTLDSSGQGPGIVTYADYSLVSDTKAANCGGPNTTCGAANPGDTLTLWATGLGPINGSDAKGDGLGVDMPNIPLTVWLGGVQAPVIYRGRGCCVGEDQIAFTVPNNTPTGCAVPLLIQIGDQISNNTVMPVASGGRDCTVSDPLFANLEPKILARQPVSFADIDLSRDFNSKGTGYQDDIQFQFVKALSYDGGSPPFFASFVENPPVGTCLVYNKRDTKANVPINNAADLNAGSSFTVKGPNGSVPVAGVTAGKFNATLNAAGTFLDPGSYTVTGIGGPDVGPINATATFPPPVTLITPASPPTVTRANGMTITWSGGVANAIAEIQVWGSTDSSGANGATVECKAPATAGTFTIPSYAMLALPAGNFGGLYFLQENINTTFTATGLDLAVLNAFGAPTGFNGFTLK